MTFQQNDHNEALRAWRPPEDHPVITTLDVHTEGEPLRIIIDGFPEVTGKSILDQRRNIRERFDHLRTALMWEPRGHADMYGCLITPPCSDEADFGILFLHNEGYSSMCGHGIIAVAKVVLEARMFPMCEPETVVKIDTPAGLVIARAHVREGKVASVRFRNVPSFVVSLDDTVTVPGLGRVTYDLAFGGAFYVFVQAADVGLSCVPEDFRGLIETGMTIKHAVMDQRPIEHPFEPDLGFLYGTIFIGPAEADDADSRNVCIFAEGEVDRSPTGTGVSARLAIHYKRGDIGLNQPIIIESIIGSQFTGCVVDLMEYGPYEAILPEVEGRAFITGRHQFIIQPDDPLRHGFILR